MNVIKLVTELTSITDDLTNNPSGVELETLMIRRSEVIKDLLFYRYYGFVCQHIEQLMGFDPMVASMYEEIKREEEEHVVQGGGYPRESPYGAQRREVDEYRPQERRFRKPSSWSP
jgi:hypothetical protein